MFEDTLTREEAWDKIVDKAVLAQRALEKELYSRADDYLEEIIAIAEHGREAVAELRLE